MECSKISPAASIHPPKIISLIICWNRNKLQLKLHRFFSKCTFCVNTCNHVSLNLCGVVRACAEDKLVNFIWITRVVRACVVRAWKKLFVSPNEKIFLLNPKRRKNIFWGCSEVRFSPPQAEKTVILGVFWVGFPWNFRYVQTPVRSGRRGKEWELSEKYCRSHMLVPAPLS